MMDHFASAKGAVFETRFWHKLNIIQGKHAYGTVHKMDIGHLANIGGGGGKPIVLVG